MEQMGRAGTPVYRFELVDFHLCVVRCFLKAWVEQTDNGSHTVALEDMDEASEFYAGTVEDRRFRYLNAKHEVDEWMETHKRQGLLKLIDKLNNGEAFLIVYNG